MNENKKTDLLYQLGFIGIPIIAIIAAICYSVISRKSPIPSNQKESKNPFEYNIENLKEVPPELVKYKEIDKISFVLKDPNTISIGKENKIYIAGNGKVETDSNTLNIKFKDQIDITGIPSSMSISEDGNIALCYDKKILFTTPGGKEIFKIENLPEKALLTSIAIEGDYIYVADAGRKIILQFDKKGDLKSRIGEEDKKKGIQGFIVPSANFDIIPGGDESIWAVNPGRLQIENYTSDGRLRSSWKAAATGIEGFSGCCNPSKIALLPNGDFVTAEKNIVRVKVYDPTGKFKCVVATPQQFAEDAKILDIATDKEGKIYVLDSKNDGIRVFETKGN